METYTVKVHILKGDKNGKRCSENLEYKFNEPRLIESRNLAIAKTKEIIHSYENEMPKGEEFDSFFIAQLKEFKNFKSYSLDIIFSVDDDEYHIYGEEKEIIIEELIGEAMYYNENDEYQELCEIEDLDGEIIFVLESNLDFFLN
jgi:hypothetical protein